MFDKESYEQGRFDAVAEIDGGKCMAEGYTMHAVVECKDCVNGVIDQYGMVDCRYDVQKHGKEYYCWKGVPKVLYDGLDE